MARINILDSSVYNLIAAGEVVERPASVVKELVENCIDAKASIITVELVGGGISSIVVTDNGCGIEHDDLKSAFLPHATSKIKTGEDLDSILTLGFRGEALASISAVSKATIISRVKDSDVGGKIVVEGGKFLGIEQVGAPVGTTAKIENLFYNVPARAKFLKKPKQEELEVTNLITRFILANPNISFRYIADGKLVYQSTGAGEEDALFCIYGKEAITETLKISNEYAGTKVHGVIGKGSFSKPNRTYQTIVINGRHINNYQIGLTVAAAYGEMLMKRQYPFFVIYIEMPADAVDVNVHPNKMEVRFDNTNKVLSIIHEACMYALNHNVEIREIKTPDYAKDLKISQEEEVIRFPISPISMPKNSKIDYAGATLANKDHGFMELDNVEVDDEIKEEETPIDLGKTVDTNDARDDSQFLKTLNTISVSQKGINVGTADGFGIGSSLLEQFMVNPDKTGSIEPVPVPPPSTKDFPASSQECIEIRTDVINIGKIFNTYLIIQDPTSIYLIDQHAAHERILFEKFKDEIDSGEIAVQPMLAPYILSVNPLEINILEDNLDNLRSLGFEIEEFGLNTYRISSVPVIVSEINFDRFFSLFLQENKKITQLKAIDLIKEQIMQLSCKSAVKAGYDLTKTEIEKLYQEMSKEKVALYCPHGRPIIIRVTKQEIEKWFKRIV